MMTADNQFTHEWKDCLTKYEVTVRIRFTQKLYFHVSKWDPMETYSIHNIIILVKAQHNALTWQPGSAAYKSN